MTQNQLIKEPNVVLVILELLPSLSNDLQVSNDYQTYHFNLTMCKCDKIILALYINLYTYLHTCVCVS